VVGKHSDLLPEGYKNASTCMFIRCKECMESKRKEEVENMIEKVEREEKKARKLEEERREKEKAKQAEKEKAELEAKKKKAEKRKEKLISKLLAKTN
jgi:dsDNA-specific endonuclease/ATPase MutS2